MAALVLVLGFVVDGDKFKRDARGDAAASVVD